VSRVLRGAAALALILILALHNVTAAHADGGCAGLSTTTCGLNGSAGNFHGLIAVDGAPWVLNLAGHGGTTAGCGDCSWSTVLACHTESPTNPGGPPDCAAANIAAGCPKGQLSFRLYLTTDAATDTFEGLICLGGGQGVIPIGDQAKADVDRYLKDVIPPNLEIATNPRAATLAGLETYFSATTPATLVPAPFGGPQITETITIAPIRADWRWGDGTASGWEPATADPTHSYVHGGTAIVTLSARWGATYTVTYQGETFGPYDAVGQLTKRQTRTMAVHTSSPTLVSH
jgi:hypothetical protein